MSWGDDLATRLVASGVGVYNTNIFLSSKRVMPVGAGPFLQIRETGGTSPERTHNSAPGISAQRPAAQIEVRAATHAAAREMARLAYNSLVGVRNTTINGTWYRSIDAVQEPFDLGLDETARIRYAFNVRGAKAPS